MQQLPGSRSLRQAMGVSGGSPVVTVEAVQAAVGKPGPLLLDSVEVLGSI